MTLVALLLFAFQQQAVRDDQCISCHVDAADEAKGSLHERAGVGCVSCHGTDEIVNEKHRRTAAFRPAKVRQVPAVCGACHQAAADAFRGSAHAELPHGDVILPEQRSVCSACHDYHATPVASRTSILKHCLKCHEEKSYEVNVATEAYADVDKLENSLGRFDGLLRDLRLKPGIRVSDLEGATREGRSALTRCRIAQHSMDWKPLRADATAAAVKTAAAYNALASREEAFSRRFLGLGLFLGLLVLSAALIVRRARTLQGAS